jgi:hypothetical protein
MGRVITFGSMDGLRDFEYALGGLAAPKISCTKNSERYRTCIKDRWSGSKKKATWNLSTYGVDRRNGPPGSILMEFVATIPALKKKRYFDLRNKIAKVGGFPFDRWTEYAGGVFGYPRSDDMGIKGFLGKVTTSNTKFAAAYAAYKNNPYNYRIRVLQGGKYRREHPIVAAFYEYIENDTDFIRSNLGESFRFTKHPILSIDADYHANAATGLYIPRNVTPKELVQMAYYEGEGSELYDWVLKKLQSFWMDEMIGCWHDNGKCKKPPPWSLIVGIFKFVVGTAISTFGTPAAGAAFMMVSQAVDTIATKKSVLSVVETIADLSANYGLKVSLPDVDFKIPKEIDNMAFASFAKDAAIGSDALTDDEKKAAEDIMRKAAISVGMGFTPYVNASAFADRNQKRIADARFLADEIEYKAKRDIFENKVSPKVSSEKSVVPKSGADKSIAIRNFVLGGGLVMKFTPHHGAEVFGRNIDNVMLAIKESAKTNNAGLENSRTSSLDDIDTVEEPSTLDVIAASMARPGVLLPSLAIGGALVGALAIKQINKGKN